MCACVSACVHAGALCAHPQRPEESAEFPGTGHADGCESPTVGAGASL